MSDEIDPSSETVSIARDTADVSRPTLVIKPQVDIYEQTASFRELIVKLFGKISSRLSSELAYNLEATCFMHKTVEWSEFRMRQEIPALLEKYGYDSIQDWDNHTYGNHLNTVYLTKSQVQEIMDERVDEAVQKLLLEESRKIHPLFSMIIADNFTQLMGISAYQALRDMDPDDVRVEARRLLKSEARKQLRNNKFFSFQQWEEKLKKEFGE